MHIMSISKEKKKLRVTLLRFKIEMGKVESFLPIVPVFFSVPFKMIHLFE